MTILDKVLQGSFRGVKFLMISGEVSGGPKIVIHEYPNQDTQTVETLGIKPRTYAIQIMIGGGADYLETRDNILRILEDDTLGTLVHPLYGTIENVIALPYTLTENFDSLGRGSVNVTFEISEGTGIPEQTNNTINAIEVTHTDVLNKIGSGFVAGYGIQANQPATYTDALDKGNAVVGSFDTNSKTLQGATDTINGFTKDITAFGNNITAIINDPQEFANSIQRAYTSLTNLYPTSVAVVRVIEKFFNFGEEDNAFKLNTPSRITRTNNRNAVNGAMQATALSYSYFYSAQSDYVTVTDINNRSDTLENQYQKAMVDPGLDNDTKEALTELRLNTNKFFDDEKLTAQQIISINTPLLSDRLIAFQYYGDSILGAQISELNANPEPTFSQGDIQILTE